MRISPASLVGGIQKQLSREKEKFSLRHCTGVLKTARRLERLKSQLSREKEKFSLRHCTEVLKTARWMERFKNSCPERKKNFHSDIVLKFLKRLA